jgi:hypothetical protein
MMPASYTKTPDKANPRRMTALGRCQSLIEIGKNIVNMLNAD